MALQETARPAGQLSPNAFLKNNHFNLDNKPSVVVETKGRGNLGELIHRSGLVEELEQILLHCGYGGVFKLIPTKTVKGTSHTKGLHFKEPAKTGVVVRLHGAKASNDSNVEAVLLKPFEFDCFQFFTSLKMVQKTLEDHEDEPAEELSPPPVHAVPKPQEPPLTLQAEAAPVATAPAEKGHIEIRDFARDPENTQLFLGELAKSADTQGRVPGKAASEILTRDFGLIPKAVGGVMFALYNRKLLKKLDPRGVVLQIENWSPPVEATVVQQTAAATPETTSLSSKRNESEPGSLSSHIEQLERRAQLYERTEVRLAEVGAELLKVEEALEPLLTRQQNLLQEQIKLNSKLSEPDLSGARQKFEQIMSLLGK